MNVVYDLGLYSGIKRYIVEDKNNKVYLASYIPRSYWNNGLFKFKMCPKITTIMSVKDINTTLYEKYVVVYESVGSQCSLQHYLDNHTQLRENLLQKWTFQLINLAVNLDMSYKIDFNEHHIFIDTDYNLSFSHIGFNNIHKNKCISVGLGILLAKLWKKSNYIPNIIEKCIDELINKGVKPEKIEKKIENNNISLEDFEKCVMNESKIYGYAIDICDNDDKEAIIRVLKSRFQKEFTKLDGAIREKYGSI